MSGVPAPTLDHEDAGMLERPSLMVSYSHPPPNFCYMKKGINVLFQTLMLGRFWLNATEPNPA